MSLKNAFVFYLKYYVFTDNKLFPDALIIATVFNNYELPNVTDPIISDLKLWHVLYILMGQFQADILQPHLQF